MEMQQKAKIQEASLSQATTDLDDSNKELLALHQSLSVAEEALHNKVAAASVID